MAQLIEYVDELIQEVGPRPAGTQQEHQAAELIAARLDEFGMKVDIEEFPCARNVGWVRILYYALCLIGVVVSIALAEFRILGVILIAAGAVLMLLDYLGKNPLFTLFKNSLSQNVIARYLPPGSEPSSRNRKVVILAHYDSARPMVQAAPGLVP
jgi:acetylornithine deacetylase/succinyl-diaminopimelate desuccinylase-like protein